MAAFARTIPAQLFPLVGMKLKFDNLGGFFRRRHELPFLHGVLASLDEQGMATHNASALHMTVRRDNDFNLDLAGHVHALCEFWIDWQCLGFYFALRFVRRTRLRESGNP